MKADDSGYVHPTDGSDLDGGITLREHAALTFAAAWLSTVPPGFTHPARPRNREDYKLAIMRSEGMCRDAFALADAFIKVSREDAT